MISLLKERYPHDKDLEESIKWAKLTVEDDLAYLAYKGNKGMLKESPVVAVKEFELFMAYPNSFSAGGRSASGGNPTTTLRFDLPKSGLVNLRIFDVLGRQVRTLVDRRLRAGSHEVKWDGKDSNGSDATAGLYFACLKTEDEVKTVKLLLVR